MNAQEVRTLVAYNRWSNRGLPEAAADLGPEQLHRDLGVSLGSLHGTLLHLTVGRMALAAVLHVRLLHRPPSGR